MSNFSGLIGKKVIDKENLTGSIVGVYPYHEAWFAFVFGAMETKLIFILRSDKDQRIFEVTGDDFFENFKVVDN